MAAYKGEEYEHCTKRYDTEIINNIMELFSVSGDLKSQVILILLRTTKGLSKLLSQSHVGRAACPESDRWCLRMQWQPR